MTGCFGSNSNYKLTYNFLYLDFDSATSTGSWWSRFFGPDRVESFAEYYFDFAKKVLEYCADCFGPQPKNGTHSMYENGEIATLTVQGNSFYTRIFNNTSSNFDDSYSTIANELSIVDHVYYDELSSDNIAILVISNFDFEKSFIFGDSNSILTGYETSSRIFSLNEGLKGRHTRFASLATLQGVDSVSQNCAYRYSGGEGHAYLFIGPAIGSGDSFVDITSIDGATRLLNNLYRGNNTNVIQWNIINWPIAMGEVKSFTTDDVQIWNYAITNWPYDDATSYKFSFVGSTKFSAYPDSAFDPIWDLAKELVLAKRFGYGQDKIPAEKLHYTGSERSGGIQEAIPYYYHGSPEHSQDTILNTCKTLDKLYEYLKDVSEYNEQIDGNYPVSGWERDLICCAVYYMMDPAITTDDISAIKDAVLNVVIGYTDAPLFSDYRRDYDVIVEKIIEKCIEESPYSREYVYPSNFDNAYYYADISVSETFEQNSNLDKEVGYNADGSQFVDETDENDETNPKIDNEHVDFYNASTYFTQSVLLYSYFHNFQDFSYEDGDRLVWDGGRVKFRGASIGLTLVDGSSQEDYEDLSTYYVTMMTYYKYIDGEGNRCVSRVFCSSKLAQDGSSNVYYADFEGSEYYFVLHNQYVGWLNLLTEAATNDNSRDYADIKAPGYTSVKKTCVQAGGGSIEESNVDTPDYTTKDEIYEYTFNSSTQTWVRTKKAVNVINKTTGTVPGYGTYYDGNGSLGECFIQFIITSPDPSKRLNVVIDYLDIDYEN